MIQNTDRAMKISSAPSRFDLDIFSEIDLNLMVTFLVIFNERNLSRTAEKLGVKQPAISNALAKLRLHFNDVLFERAGYGVQPTPRAEFIFMELTPAINSIQALLQRERFSVK
jgi:DNA-binding transcriptional LysR family regulator